MSRTIPAGGAKPNVVFIIADQLRYQSCGFAGDARARTPQLDALAKQGVVFRNAVSGHPVCAAFRASLFTGKYTTSTGMVINELRMNTNHVFLAQVLDRAGYDTAYIGKWHLWAKELGNHYDPKNSFVPPGPYRFGFDGFWAAYNFHHEYDKAYYHTDSPEKIAVNGYEPDVQTELAIGQVKRLAEAGKPFALFVWSARRTIPGIGTMFRRSITPCSPTRVGRPGSRCRQTINPPLTQPLTIPGLSVYIKGYGHRPAGRDREVTSAFIARTACPAISRLTQVMTINMARKTLSGTSPDSLILPSVQ